MAKLVSESVRTNKHVRVCCSKYDDGNYAVSASSDSRDGGAIIRLTLADLADIKEAITLMLTAEGAEKKR